MRRSEQLHRFLDIRHGECDRLAASVGAPSRSALPVSVGAGAEPSDEGSDFGLFDEREDFEEAGVEGALAAEEEVWLFEPGLRALLIV